MSWTMRPLAELPAFSVSSRGNGGRLYQAGLPGRGCAVVPLAASTSDQGLEPAPSPTALPAGTNVDPLVPALEKIWADSMGQSLADFNFR